MKAATNLLGIALPLATIVTLTLLLTAGGVPQVGGLPDLIVYALELAPRTMYALAIGGSAAVAMQVTGMNIANERRCELLNEAAGGELGPIIVLAGETFAWLAWSVLWAVVYLHG